MRAARSTPYSHSLPFDRGTRRSPRKDFDGITYPQHTCTTVHHVLREIDMAAGATVLRKRTQRLLALYGRLLLDGRDRAARTRLHHVEVDAASPEPLPLIFFVRPHIVHHDIRPKSVDAHGRGDRKSTRLNSSH